MTGVDISTQNWSGHVRFGAARFHRPSTVAELAAIVGAAAKVKVIGSRHCFNEIADTDGDLVWLGDLDRRVVIDRERHTATVSAAVTYRELGPELHRAGYALPNLASLGHITVAGACATATHGSGDALGNLSTAVSGLELVTADGEVVTLSRAANPDTFPGAVVALGALGVVTTVTLDLEPTYQIQQNVYEELPLEHLFDHFDELASAGYSVSFFPTWQFDRVDRFWVKRRVEGALDVPESLFGATVVSRDRPVAHMPDRTLTTFWEPGPWHERLPHLVLADPLAEGDELQSEYFVARHHVVGALRAIAALRAELAPVLWVSELRTVAADDLWLSTAHGGDVVAIHFNWLKDWPGVRAVLPVVEAALAPFEPRPHWGKLFAMGADQIRPRYPRLADFEALMATLDPAGKFRNRYIDRYVLGID